MADQPFAALDLAIELLASSDAPRRHAMLHLAEKARKQWAADRERIAALTAALQTLSGDFAIAVRQLKRAEEEAIEKAGAACFRSKSNA